MSKKDYFDFERMIDEVGVYGVPFDDSHITKLTKRIVEFTQERGLVEKFPDILVKFRNKVPAPENLMDSEKAWLCYKDGMEFNILDYDKRRQRHEQVSAEKSGSAAGSYRMAAQFPGTGLLLERYSLLGRIL